MVLSKKKPTLNSEKLNSQISFFVRCFGIVQNSTVLDYRWGQEVFRTLYFLYKRYVEDPFYGLVKQHPELCQNGHVLDIGANIGYTSHIFAKAIQPRFKVFAFEPEEHTFALLYNYIHDKGLQNSIVSVRAAVGSSEGEVNIWRNRYHSGDHRTITKEFIKLLGNSTDEIQSVPAITIDAFLESQHIREPISLIKIDVQGYELPVCYGMEKTLTMNSKASVAFEYSPDQMRQLGFDENSLLDFFSLRNFQLYLIEHAGKLMKLDDHLLGDHLNKYGYVNILATRQNMG
jgi:FkbM family methyltransferase